MPSRYVLRNFYENGIYHVYNRGVEKRNIFESETDYKILLYYLFVYLAPTSEVLTTYPNLPFRLQGKNLEKEVSLISYCLMPNHMHFLIQQITIDGVSKFMKQVTNAYTEYFNKKYKRDGCLMQGRYKAVEVTSDNVLHHISRYIHLNPLVAGIVREFNEWPWSSALEYTNNKKGLCNKELIQCEFKTASKYKRFLNNHLDYARKLADIKHMTIDG